MDYRKKYGKSVIAEGSFINDVTALGEGYQGFCDDRTESLLLKYGTMGEGVSKIA
jgi:hypothetical protein